MRSEIIGLGHRRRIAQKFFIFTVQTRQHVANGDDDCLMV
jgi:hypothetical protein